MSVALVVVSESVYVSELEFHLAELATSVTEAVEGESVESRILVLFDDLVESISSFIIGNSFRHFLFLKLYYL